jgi:hypothetical protein
MRRPVLLALVPLLAATPLQAQFWSPPGNGLPRTYAPPPAEHSATLHDVRQAIRDGRRDGELSREDARQLRREQRILSAIAERYAADGLNAGEAADLDFRAHALLDQVQASRRQR